MPDPANLLPPMVDAVNPRLVVDRLPFPVHNQG
jgi:hypothetical protein